MINKHRRILQRAIQEERTSKAVKSSQLCHRLSSLSIMTTMLHEVIFGDVFFGHADAIGINFQMYRSPYWIVGTLRMYNDDGENDAY